MFFVNVAQYSKLPPELGYCKSVHIEHIRPRTQVLFCGSSVVNHGKKYSFWYLFFKNKTLAAEMSDCRHNKHHNNVLKLLRHEYSWYSRKARVFQPINVLKGGYTCKVGPCEKFCQMTYDELTIKWKLDCHGTQILYPFSWAIVPIIFYKPLKSLNLHWIIEDGPDCTVLPQGEKLLLELIF